MNGSPFMKVALFNRDSGSKSSCKVPTARNIQLAFAPSWLLSDSPKGAAASSMVYTMVEMAKANNLNTYKYLTYILAKRPNETMSNEQLEQLTPWSEAAKANCQN